jgi:deoxyribonuclease-4
MKTMIGSNVPAIGGLATAFEVADRWECECIQVYVTPSRRWMIPEMTENEVNAIKAAWAKSGVRHVVAHVPFLVNIASPDAVLRQKSTRRLAVELKRANRLGVQDLVLHPGSHGSSERKSGINNIVLALKEVLREVPERGCRIALETMAGQGSTIGSRHEELIEILDRVGGIGRLSVCLDTCHLFAAGYQLKGYDGYERTIQEIISLFGIERISVIHLNDSVGECGSRLDRHASIGEGRIGYEVFHALMQDVRFRDIPKILEIPDRDERSVENLRLLRRLGEINGRITDTTGLRCLGGAYAGNC